VNGLPLRDAPEFRDYAMLLMNASGRFVRRDGAGNETEVHPQQLAGYLDEKIAPPEGVTDVFVWVHGWRNDYANAIRAAKRMFHGIAHRYQSAPEAYPRLVDFRPGFVAVHWPSMSQATPWGYKMIRDRAAAMTEDGYAEFFLASLLGYLKPAGAGTGGERLKTLRSRRGYYVHCLGHSFGGRFLTAAVRTATEPKAPPTRTLIRETPAAGRRTLSARDDGQLGGGRFEFQVDSILVFQMAAPNRRFGGQLRSLLESGSLCGPIVLTYSPYDRANCLWHRFTEGNQRGIGCTGALEPKDRLKAAPLREVDSAYALDDFSRLTVVNVDASELYRHAGWCQFEGAHSDFYYQESAHLILSVANSTR
jgi:hypothetical protein